ncbi:MAG: hypothetical protein WDO18_16035 [Acidobacteriota bacterium]
MRKIAEADFPSRFGHFRIEGYECDANGEVEESVVLKMGDLTEGPPPLVRIHSECLTGDVFHSLRCDCRGAVRTGAGVDREKRAGAWWCMNTKRAAASA